MELLAICCGFGHVPGSYMPRTAAGQEVGHVAPALQGLCCCSSTTVCTTIMLDQLIQPIMIIGTGIGGCQ